jgi:hypothetical protein
MSKQVRRFDYSEVKGAEKTAQGYLRAPAIATRIGVFKYRKNDGTILRELRMPEEVFNKDSMKTLAGIPLTNDHPKELLLDSANTKNYMIGFTGEKVEPSEKFLKTTITITDGDTIELVSTGKQQLSCGYTCELEEKSGHFDGEEYDVIQRNIRYNHLALVNRGRAGNEVRIKLDQDDAMLDENSNKKEQDNHKGAEMEKINIDGREFEVSKEVKDAFESFISKQKKNDDNEKVIEEKTKELDATKAKLDSASEQVTKLNEKITELEKAKNDSISKEEISKLVKERVKLEKVAAHFGVEKLDVSDIDLKKAVILADSKNAKLDDKSESYIDARFDAVCENVEEITTKQDNLGKELSQKRKEETKNDSEKSREAAMQRARDSWKQPLSTAKA